MTTTNSNTFEIGLTMAGAVSAGAYTAGVIDFLIQALDEWQKAVERAAPETPTHAVNLKVMSGASAGALVGAIIAANSRVIFPPVMPGTDEVQGVLNPLFRAWVNRIDISELLKTQDLAAGGYPLSLLDTTIIDQIGNDVVTQPTSGNVTNRGYIAQHLRAIYTLTNVTGVPYGYRSRGNAQYTENIVAHDDIMRFAVSGAGLGTSPPPRTAAGWNHEYVVDMNGSAALLPLLKEAAIASAAFPLGLKPRELTRDRNDYIDRPVLVSDQDPTKGPTVEYLEPTWPTGSPQSYNFVNMDGGCINNDPFELARTELAGGPTARNERDGAKASKAVVIIDPFPGSGPTAGPQSEADIPLQMAPFTLLGVYKDQARFSPEEIALAMNDDIYSRFLVAPVRSTPGTDGGAPDPAAPGPWIASGGLGGFSGFFARNFRLHDYLLGRRNCQQFLRSCFSLKSDNPLFDCWSGASWATKYKIPTSDGTTHWFELPIIPLMDSVTREEPEPIWPYKRFDPESIRRPVSNRLNALFQRWMEGESLLSKAAKFAWWIWGRNFVTSKTLNAIRAALVSQRLLPRS